MFEFFEIVFKIYQRNSKARGEKNDIRISFTNLNHFNFLYKQTALEDHSSFSVSTSNGYYGLLVDYIKIIYHTIQTLSGSDGDKMRAT